MYRWLPITGYEKSVHIYLILWQEFKKLQPLFRVFWIVTSYSNFGHFLQSTVLISFIVCPRSVLYFIKRSLFYLFGWRRFMESALLSFWGGTARLLGPQVDTDPGWPTQSLPKGCGLHHWGFGANTGPKSRSLSAHGKNKGKKEI